jgi:hypothetical protein
MGIVPILLWDACAIAIGAVVVIAAIVWLIVKCFKRAQQ